MRDRDFAQHPGHNALVKDVHPLDGVQRRRRPGERDRRYLAALVEWGYKPSDVEQLVLTPPTQAAEATADASQVDGTDLLDADSTAPEADAEDVAEATADASQVDGTDLLDADSTAPEP